MAKLTKEICYEALINCSLPQCHGNMYKYENDGTMIACCAIGAIGLPNGLDQFGVEAKITEQVVDLLGEETTDQLISDNDDGGLTFPEIAEKYFK